MTGEAPAEDPVLVVYIAGSGRSGSTLLDGMLGQVAGVAAVGELRYVWERGVLANRLCGCGRPFRDCPLWSRVLAGLGVDEDRARRMAADQRRHLRVRNLPRELAADRGLLPRRPLGDFAPALAEVYRAVSRETGCRVLVDSSKLPAYGHLLARLPSVDLRVVQLVRDARATAYSWQRTRDLPDVTGDGQRQQMMRLAPWRSAVLWTLWNSVAELLWRPVGARYLLLRYEDMVADPRAALRRVLAMVGDPDADLPLEDGGMVHLSATHSVAGNPSRFSHGAVRLRPDEEWRTAMRWRDRALVTAVTFPLLRRYGYRVLGRPAGVGAAGRPEGASAG